MNLCYYEHPYSKCAEPKNTEAQAQCSHYMRKRIINRMVCSHLCDDCRCDSPNANIQAYSALTKPTGGFEDETIS
jgi:hypothetical protein